MDYGQTNDKQKFDRLFEQAITSGEGTAPESTNPDIAESLHSTDDSIVWETQPDISSPANLSKRGRDAISSSAEALPDSPDQPPLPPSHRKESSNLPKLGEVVTLAMPPDSPTIAQPAQTDTAPINTDSSPSSILSHLHLDHQKFTDTDTKLVDAAIAASGDDISDLYDAIRNLVPTSVNNQGGEQNGK